MLLLGGGYMLYDERDLRVFDNSDARNYFKEILQSYYSQNYRATIVLLYSFVIYDLFIKLQTMADEGDTKAKSKLVEINSMIASDEKYSKVENEIVEFFKKNCSLYFERFIEDIEYLKTCRNKCAHLKVNDNSLYVPNDYHAKMMICSMYDHVLSVKAPFIMDLFSIVESEIEEYTTKIPSISENGLDESIKKSINDKYLNRMTYDSLKKSYNTFIKLLFLVDEENCIQNLSGLYAFVFSMTGYIIENGYSAILSDQDISSRFLSVRVENLRRSSLRAAALTSIIVKFPIIMDILRANTDVFDYLCKSVLTKPSGLRWYRAFYPSGPKSVYSYFKDTRALKIPNYTELIYNIVKDSEDFNLGEYTKIMVESIPSFNGFDSADSYMVFLKKHLVDLSKDEIRQVLSIYNSKEQCTSRSRHEEDIAIIEEYLNN